MLGVEGVVSWDHERALPRDQVLEVRCVNGTLYVARKERHPDEWDRPVAPYDPYGPAVFGEKYRRISNSAGHLRFDLWPVADVVFKTEGLVELTWLPGTQEIQFMSQPSAEVGAWRDEVIVPKYEKAGVKKIAWVWPGLSPDEMGTGAGYQQRYFATRDEAINWCVAPS
jgi:hypothetical protein